MDKKYKILIIDDEEEICRYTKSLLEKTGKFQAMTSTKGVEGLEMAKANSPDLILLDILLPDMDGSDVAARLFEEEATSKIPVIFMTALAKNDDMENGSGKIGGRFFMPKPINPKDLISRIESILNL